MTTQPPPDDFPKYTGPSDEETLEFGPSHNRPGHHRPGASRPVPGSGTGHVPGAPGGLSAPQPSPRPAQPSSSHAQAGPAEIGTAQGELPKDRSAPVGNRVAATVARTQGWWQEKLHQLSLHARVTLLAAVTVGLAVAFVSIGAYVTVRQQMYRNLDDSLKDRAVQAAKNGVLTNYSNLQIASNDALGLSDIQFGIYLADGEKVSPKLSPLPPMGPAELAVAKGTAPDDGISIETIGVPDNPYPHFRVIAVPAQFCPRDDGRKCGEGDETIPAALVVAQSLKPIDRTLHNLGIVLWAVGLLGVIGAALAGNAIAQSGLRPLARLTGAAETIARTEDLRPIPVTGSDEITRLAVAFNAMLAALARSQDRQRRLVGDAGHELRTPLTSIRTNLDLLAQADKRGGLRPEDRQQVLDDVRAQMDELTTLIGDLTELARDTPQVRDAELIEMSNVVEDALIKVRRRASGVEWDVQLSPFPVWGDERLLGRAVTNLLDNAAKYSVPDDSIARPLEGEPLGRVTVRLLDGVLTVTDSGPGIAEADLPHVFERFYRSSEARSRPGSGLGLAIVKHAAEQHGGMIYARNAPSAGAQFTLWLPHAATQSR